MSKKEILPLDPAIERYYSLGKEKDRLSTFRLEKDRTLRILKKAMPLVPAIVLDVGGAHGIYAFPLAEQGYEVHLIDPILIHVEQAKEYAKNFPSTNLASYSVGDARKINRLDNSVDVILFFGPLYHLVEQNDRLMALNEAYRILKPGGILFAAAISRYTSFIDGIYKDIIYSNIKIVEENIRTGIYSSENSKTVLYFHHPRELKDEIKKCRFADVSILGIEGPVWHQGMIEGLQQNVQGWEQLLSLLDMIESEETIIGASAHIMAIAKK